MQSPSPSNLEAGLREARAIRRYFSAATNFIKKERSESNADQARGLRPDPFLHQRHKITHLQRARLLRNFPGVLPFDRAAFFQH
jgi:hypothetical protein